MNLYKFLIAGIVCLISVFVNAQPTVFGIGTPQSGGLTVGGINTSGQSTTFSISQGNKTWVSTMGNNTTTTTTQGPTTTQMTVSSIGVQNAAGSNSFFDSSNWTIGTVTFSASQVITQPGTVQTIQTSVPNISAFLIDIQSSIQSAANAEAAYVTTLSNNLGGTLQAKTKDQDSENHDSEIIKSKDLVESELSALTKGVKQIRNFKDRGLSVVTQSVLPGTQ